MSGQRRLMAAASGSYLLANQLTGKLRSEKCYAKYSIPQVVVVRRQLQVWQEVVRIGLREVASIDVQLEASVNLLS